MLPYTQVFLTCLPCCSEIHTIMLETWWANIIAVVLKLNHPLECLGGKGCFNTDSYILSQKILIQRVWGQTWEFAFLTSFQVKLMLLIKVPQLENQWCRMIAILTWSRGSGSYLSFLLWPKAQCLISVDHGFLIVKWWVCARWTSSTLQHQRSMNSCFHCASDPGKCPHPLGELLLHHAWEFFSSGQSPAVVCKGFQKKQEQLNKLISISYF